MEREIDTAFLKKPMTTQALQGVKHSGLLGIERFTLSQLGLARRGLCEVERFRALDGEFENCAWLNGSLCMALISGKLGVNGFRLALRGFGKVSISKSLIVG